MDILLSFDVFFNEQSSRSITSYLKTTNRMWKIVRKSWTMSRDWQKSVCERPMCQGSLLLSPVAETKFNFKRQTIRLDYNIGRWFSNFLMARKSSVSKPITSTVVWLFFAVKLQWQLSTKEFIWAASVHHLANCCNSPKNRTGELTASSTSFPTTAKAGSKDLFRNISRSS